jgi:hypothetical protein
MGSHTIPQKRRKVDLDYEEIIKDGTLTSAAENFFEALCTSVALENIWPWLT